MNQTRFRVLAVAGTAAAAAALATIALASPGSGTSTTILAPRSTLAQSVQMNEERIKLQTKDPTDFVTQQVSFVPHAYSGWHHHPGFILVLVKSGQVTVHDENCQTKTYSAGESFVEGGSAPMMVSNESDTVTAVDVATQVAPQGSAFRIEDDPPSCAQ
jgi:quercetin dioxygenase-like cupin family protein